MIDLLGGSAPPANGYERPIGGGQSVTALPRCSDVNLLGDGERIVDFDAEIPDRALHLGVAKEQLNRPEIPGTLIDQSGFGSPQRWVPNKDGPMPASHSDIRRAYWRVERQRSLP